MLVQNRCTWYPETQRQAHQPVMGARGAGMVAAGAPHSPKRSSTVHTSARRPPGAGEARSGALQERPARKSRACTYSRPSALAWATSSLSVGERSKASMISAAKTEERRSTSMAEAQASGTTPTTDKAQPDSLQPSGEGTPATQGDLEAQCEAQRSPPRAPRSSADPKLTEEVGWEPPSKRASFGWPLVLLPKPFKIQCHVLLGSKLNHRRWSRVGNTAGKNGNKFCDHSAQARGPVWERRRMQSSLGDQATGALPGREINSQGRL